MDLGNLLAERTRRLGLAVACALGLCLIVLAFLNTQAQQRQNKNLIETATRAALALARAPGAQGDLSHAVITQVSKESERLTLSQELRENAIMAVVSFAAFVAFAALLIALQKRTIRSALAPVQRMVQELEAFEAGDLDRRLPEVPLRELDSVSRSFNHLAESLQASINSQDQLSRQLIEMRQLERLNLARDLHDDLGQTLTAAAIEIEAARLEAFGRPHSMTKNTQRAESNAVSLGAPGVYSEVHAAPPHHLDKIEKSLERARLSLRQLTAQLRGETTKDSDHDFAALISFWKRLHPEIHWHFSEYFIAQLDALDLIEKPVIFRILQESLTNVFKHSQPSICRMAISSKAKASSLDLGSAGRLKSLEIRNDGIQTQVESPSGFGIEGMKERAAAINACFEAGLGNDGMWSVRLEWFSCES